MILADTPTQAPFALLDGYQFINLTTYRKNGTEVTRPVWFATQNNMLYLISVEDSGKIKHIRNNPNVIVSPCDARGNPLSDTTVQGYATLYTQGHPTAQQANRALNQKYGLFKRLFGLSFLWRRATVVWVEIEPRS